MTSRLLVLFLYLVPYEAAAIMALEIKPQDVYQAGYCKAFVEGALSASTEQIPAEAANTVRLKANDLISGGDNLSFVPIGEQAARTDLIEILGVKGGERTKARKIGLITAKVEDCASLLTEIVDRYKGHSCGYGRDRNFSKTHLLDQGSEELTWIDRLTNRISD